MFTEGRVEVDGVGVRYLEAGNGSALVHVNGGPPTRAHDLLARQFRVIALEAPDPSPTVVGRAVASLGIGEFDLMATAEAGAAALRLALEAPERVRALVLESPTAIRDDGSELSRRLSEVAAPTLVVFGTGDRQDVQDTGRIYAETIPNGHLVFVYDAGGAIGRDRPEAFAEVVADFLERREAFVISRGQTVIHP